MAVVKGRDGRCQLLLLLVLYVFKVQSSTQVISRNLGSVARGHWRPRAGAWNHVVPKPVSRGHSNTRIRNGRQGGKKLSSRKVKSTGGDSRDKRRTSRKFSPKATKGLSLRKPTQEVRRTQPRGNKRGGQRRPGKQESNRRGRQVDPVKAGIDFTNAEFDEALGKRCITKEEEISSLEREKVLECTHKNVEQCHYTYVTQFQPSQEEVCEENFEKSCSITFKQQAYNETVRKCYKPVVKVCNGQGPEKCRTVYESSCTTKYVEKQPGKFVGDTGCEKLPVEICGAGCTFEEGPEECHDKVIVSLSDVPEEVCDLNPQKTCRFATKLSPRLTPKHECTVVPKETCLFKFLAPQEVKKPLVTKWCLDESPTEPGELYPETNDIDNSREDGARALDILDDPLNGVSPAHFNDQEFVVPQGDSKDYQTEFLDPQLEVDELFENSVIDSDDGINDDNLQATKKDNSDNLISEYDFVPEQKLESNDELYDAENVEYEASGEDVTFPTQDFADFVDFKDF